MDVLEFTYSGVYPNERESLHNPSLPHCAAFCFRKARPRSVPQCRKEAAKFLLENSQENMDQANEIRHLVGNVC
jgi:hypothetical protein